MKNSDGFLNQQLEMTKKTLDGVLDAKLPWGRVVSEVRENYAWDFEEATVIEIMKNKKEYYDDIRKFLNINYPMPRELMEDLIKYQDASMLDPQIAYPDENTIQYNIHGVIHDGESLQNNRYQLTSENKNYDGDFYEYGKETLWWGRRVAAYKNKISVGA